jgi:hypothetical protein
MAAKSKKPSKRDAERAAIADLEKRIAAGPLLEIDSADDLAIDPFAKVYAKKQTKPHWYLRSEVARVSRETVVTVVLLIKMMPSERELANRALQSLKAADEITDWILSKNARDFALSHVAPKSRELELWIAPPRVWQQIVYHLKKVREYRRLVERFELAGVLPSNSNILASVFVAQMARFHQQRLGKRIPKARSGKFVDFINCAWDALDFPKLPEGTLGNLAERLPH